MALIPASCSHCGLLFATPNLIAGSGTFTLIGNTTNCPRCGRWADILDGTYNLLGDTVQVLAATEYSAARLRAFAKALDQARKRRATPEEVKATIKEQLPELSRFADALPRNPDQLYQFIIALCTIVIAVATVISALRGTGLTEEQKAEIVERAVKAMAVASPSPTPQPNRKQRRAAKSPRGHHK